MCVALRSFYQQGTDIAVPCFGAPYSVLITAAGILTRSQPQVRGKLPGTAKAFKISNFDQSGKGRQGLNTKETGHGLNIFLIFRLRCQFLNSPIKALQLIRQLVISRKVLRQDFLVETIRLQGSEPLQMYQGPMIFGCVIPIVMSQAKARICCSTFFSASL